MVFVRKRSKKDQSCQGNEIDTILPFKAIIIYVFPILLPSLGEHFSRCTWAFCYIKPPSLVLRDISFHFSATSSFQILECFSLSCAKLQTLEEQVGVISRPQCIECQQYRGHVMISVIMWIHKKITQNYSLITLLLKLPSGSRYKWGREII